MDTQCQDYLIDFDLNFLHETGNASDPVNKSINIFDRQKRAIIIAKRKTIATDSLVRKYHEKSEKLEQVEKNLFDAKEECRQACIDLRKATEKVLMLEKNEEQHKATTLVLKNKLEEAENRCEAIQSHVNQLELLVEDKKIQIEGLEIENQLMKSNTKGIEKKITQTEASFEKEKCILTDQIKLLIEVALKKRSIDNTIREIIKKYNDAPYNSPENYAEIEIVKTDPTTDDHNEDDNYKREYTATDSVSNIEIYIEEDSNSRDLSEVKHSNVISEVPESPSANEIYDDCNNENISSKDSGCGQSTYSGSNKSLSSPDYENESPLPPYEFKKNCCTQQFETFDIPGKTVSIDSKPNFDSDCTEKKPSSIFDKTIDPRPNNNIIIREDVLKQNVENPTLYDGQNDFEVFTILKRMSFEHVFITPIPATPTPPPIEANDSYKCIEAAKLREENQALQTSIAELAKQVLEIKSQLSKKEKDIEISLPNLEKKKKHHETHINVKSNCYRTKDRFSELFGPEEITTNQNSKQLCEKPMIDEMPLQSYDINEFENFEKNINESEVLTMSLIASDDDKISLDDLGINCTNKTDTVEENLSLLTDEEDDPIRIFDAKNNTQSNGLETEVQSVKDNLEFNKKSLESCKENCSKVTADDITCETLPDNCDINLIEEVCSINKVKKSKLSKLERLRKTLQPKTKIKYESILPSKRLRSSVGKSTISDSNNLDKLSNDKISYAKAAAVAAELRAKKQCANEKTSYKKPCPSRITNEEPDKTVNKILSESNYIVPPALVENDLKHSPPKKITRSTLKTNNNMSENKKASGSTILKDEKNEKKDQNVTKSPSKSHALKRSSSEVCEVPAKRILRSSHIKQEDELISLTSPKKQSLIGKKTTNKTCLKNYSDLDIFSQSEEPVIENAKELKQNIQNTSVLCKMIEKYCHTAPSCKAPKKTENLIQSIHSILTQYIKKILELKGDEVKPAMDALVDKLKESNPKIFREAVCSFLKGKYLKTEVLCKKYTPPAPPMKPSERILLYVISRLQTIWAPRDIISEILDCIEYKIFKLNASPQFLDVDSLSHFYAVLCRHIQAKSRLRLFLIDAMYCICFKAVPLIKQCLEVWLHIIPNAKTKMGQSPIVNCFVYLLHFYQCKDKTKRILELRYILKKRYLYDVTEWTELRLIEMLKSGILKLRDISIEKKLLRLSIILFAKRHGPQWCQDNIVKKLLLPLIGSKETSALSKRFCVSILGPLLKPYPKDMKVHCEIVITQLCNMLEQSDCHTMQEAILISLTYMFKHNNPRITQAVLYWTPKQPISLEFERIMRDFVRHKPLKAWISLLSKPPPV